MVPCLGDKYHSDGGHGKHSGHCAPLDNPGDQEVGDIGSVKEKEDIKMHPQWPIDIYISSY